MTHVFLDSRFSNNVLIMNGSNIVSLSAQYRPNYQRTIHGNRNRL